MIINRTDFLTNINDYKKLRLINKGGYGSVYLVENVRTKKRFAAKVIATSEDDEILNKQLIAKSVF